MEFKATVVSKLYATVWLHHAAWAAYAFQELIVCMQFIPCESIILTPEILGKVEERTHCSRIAMTM